MDEAVKLINIRISGEFRLQVELFMDGEQPVIAYTNTDSNQMIAQTTKFYDRLQQFLMIASQDGFGNYAVAGNALAWLHKIGKDYIFDVFGHERFKIMDYLKGKYPQWQKSLDDGQLDVNSPPPVIKSSGLGSLQIPFEFLPFFDFEWNEKIKNHDALYRAATKFMGFSTIICRELYSFDDSKVCNGIINNHGGLNLRFYNHQQLRHSEDEGRTVGNMTNVNMINPWRAPMSGEHEFQDILSDQLLYGAFNQYEKLDHIQHLACHADTRDPDSDNHTLSVSYPGNKWYRSTMNGKLTTAQLKNKFSGNFSKSPDIQYPLVFLNACAAAKINPLSTTSFPKLFYQNRNRGFIAPELPVPDELAAKFSVEFYKYLTAGNTISLAMHKARRNMLKYFQSPLGILYTIYANPWLKVDEPTLTVPPSGPKPAGPPESDAGPDITPGISPGAIGDFVVSKGDNTSPPDLGATLFM